MWLETEYHKIVLTFSHMTILNKHQHQYSQNHDNKEFENLNIAIHFRFIFKKKGKSKNICQNTLNLMILAIFWRHLVEPPFGTNN